jgi:hypothetical protein
MRGSRIAVATGAALLVLGTSGLAAHAAPGGHALKNRCPNSRTYLDAVSATASHGVLKITGHPTKFVCEKDAEFYRPSKATETFTLLKGAPIIVFSKPIGDPSKVHHVTAGKFSHYLAHQHGEPYYRYHGPKGAITKLRAAFQS